MNIYFRLSIFASCICSIICGCKPTPSVNSNDGESIDKKSDLIQQATQVPLGDNANPNAPAVASNNSPTEVKSVSIEVYQPQIRYEDYAGDCGEDIPGCEKMMFGEDVYGTIQNELCERAEYFDDEGNAVTTACLLKTPFITENDFRIAALNSGDIFRTNHKNNIKDSSKKYQIIDGIPEDAYISCHESDGAYNAHFNPCHIVGHYNDNCYELPAEKIIRVKVLSESATDPSINPPPNHVHNAIPSQPAVVSPQSTGNAPSIPALIPAPAVTIPPEQRLTFKKSIKNKKGKVEYLIFSDSQLNSDCYVSMLGNQEVLNELHYCIPFSGITKNLEHPLALTQTARQFEHYAYCSDISVEKRNIPGLAGFFEAFNPQFFNSNLKRFIDRPFQITKPQNSSKKKDNCGGRCRPHDVQCEQNFYSQVPAHSCNLVDANRQGRLTPGMLDFCKLVNPFITFTQYVQYNLKPGDVFLTASAKKGEKVLHQYWQVFDMTSRDFKFNGSPEFIWELNTCRNTIGQYGEQIVQVRDLSSKDTYEVLYAPIMQGMDARNNYCKAFNNTLINEARAGNYALIDSDSPLLKKK